jgi:dienelactone hydrolase
MFAGAFLGAVCGGAVVSLFLIPGGIPWSMGSDCNMPKRIAEHKLATRAGQALSPSTDAHYIPAPGKLSSFESETFMKWTLILRIVTTVLAAANWLAPASSEDAKQPPKAGDIERERLYIGGWDPDEPVPTYVYYKQGNKEMPVVIFMHGMGGSKESNAQRMQEWAGKGLFVVAIDAHLHGERKVPDIFPPGKNLGSLGTDYAIWAHQSSVSHTARDVSKVIDALSARPEVDLSRIGVAGISMGSSTCMVLAWKEPRISVVVGLIGAVDFWYDVTKTPPGKEQDAKRDALSPRVRQLVSSIDPLDRKAAIAPKALFLANGAKDQIDIESIKKFVKDLEPRYKEYPERLKLLEEPKTGHTVTERMWSEGTAWLIRYLLEKPIRQPK